MVFELKEVLQKVEQLDNNEQQSIAKLINEELKWENTLNKSQDKLATLANEAIKEYKSVKTAGLVSEIRDYCKIQKSNGQLAG